MKQAIGIAQLCVRLTGAALLVVGILIWTGHGAPLVPSHIAVGMAFVLSLWAVAAIGLWAGIGAVLPIRLIVWGFIIAWFGMAQRRAMVGDGHWVIRVLHLAVGLIAIGLSEAIGARVRTGTTPAAPAIPEVGPSA